MSEGSGLTIVWAYEPLEELDGRTGLVECDELVAAQLVRDAKVQDPRVGALMLKPIRAPGTYATRVMEPAPAAPVEVPAVPEVTKRGPGRPRKTP